MYYQKKSKFLFLLKLNFLKMKFYKKNQNKKDFFNINHYKK